MGSDAVQRRLVELLVARHGKILSKLQVLGKINIFGWRALRGLYHAMSSWQIAVSRDRGGCPVCNNGVEDVKHMLFTCDRAREVWKKFGI
jgi:hypothetical protein